jgi:hypothetical protein
MRRPELENYILVAPPASKYDFNFIVPCTSCGIVIQGGKDEITKEADSAKLAEKLNAREGAEVYYHLTENADHFFKEHMEELEDAINDHISDRLTIDATKVRKVKRDRRRRRKKKNLAEIKPERNHFPVKSLEDFDL